MVRATPFHEGERAVQQRLGVSDRIEPWARRVVRDHMPDEHRAFYGALPFLVAAARDGQGRPWATLLTGAEGFVRSPDARHLEIAARPVPGDALADALVEGSDLGLLGIEFATRRRNRVNGRVVEIPAPDRTPGLRLRVDQSFGNCPQYIREREWSEVPTPSAPRAQRSQRLSPGQRAWIEHADTFFIATGHRGRGEEASFGMDASHRGGDPGFVRVLDGDRLVFPDYAGNHHYNTIGNLEMDPRAGLLFVDFERGDVLQLTGRTSIDWDSPAVAAIPGARRLVHFVLEEAVVLEGALPLRWVASDEAARPLRLVEKRVESEDVTSFVFESVDGDALAGFEPGQHLPLSIALPDHAEPVGRTYSLSSDPGDPRYRISVKREPQGRVSRFLHDQLAEGAIVRARPPAGDFVLRPGRRPVVLVSVGVGLTPMVSMLHALAGEDGGREVDFVHGARDGAHHPLSEEVRRTAQRRPGIRVHVSYSRPRASDRPGRDFDRSGRVDGALLSELRPGLDADYYLCGPTGFMAALQADLEARGVAADRIRGEAFGPVG